MAVSRRKSPKIDNIPEEVALVIVDFVRDWSNEAISFESDSSVDNPVRSDSLQEWTTFEIRWMILLEENIEHQTKQTNDKGEKN